MSLEDSTSALRRAVSVNDAGHVIGQDHHRAKLTDADVWLILELADGGMRHAEIAVKFECSVHTVKAISCGRKRGQLAVGQRRIGAPRVRVRLRSAAVAEFDVIRSENV